MESNGAAYNCGSVVHTRACRAANSSFQRGDFGSVALNTAESRSSSRCTKLISAYLVEYDENFSAHRKILARPHGGPHATDCRSEEDGLAEDEAQEAEAEIVLLLSLSSWGIIGVAHPETCRQCRCDRT